MANAKIDDNRRPTLTAVSTADGQTPVRLEADPSNGALIVSSVLVAGRDYDYIDAQQTSSTVETYVYKIGGSGGTVVRTTTVTYTSSSKADIDSVEYV